jgi:hypothetical protein
MTEEVKPAGARYEGWALLAATFVVIATLTVYVRANGRETGPPKLYDWQVSSFGELVGADQAIYNALYTVKDEIPLIYDDINAFNEPGVKFRWPNLQDFDDVLLPPFYKDTSWEQNGSLTWTLHEPLAEGEMQGSTMYLGTDGQLPMQGSFLLIIGHVHAGFTNTNAIVIWWNAKNHMDMPESGFNDTLIRQGWRQVVAYSGDLEVKRLFGDPSENVDDGAENVDQLLEGITGQPADTPAEQPAGQ